MVATIFQNEDAPEEYPDPPAGLTSAAAALDSAIVWQRIEGYIAARHSSRSVEWIAEGPGDWRPPLKPAMVSAVAVWQSEAWEETTLSPSPLGGFSLPGVGPYRFTGTAGTDGDVPATVAEAYRRLAEYMVARPSKAGARSETITAGSVTLSHSRSPTWLAEAMDNSGAADLLRNLRRA